MKILFSILLLCSYYSAQATIKVVTTTSTLAALAKAIGRDHVSVISLTKSTQDPHFVEAKPSYMVKLRQADLLVAVGLDLEIGWLSNVQRGSKNPNLLKGNKGFFAAGDKITPIEITKGKVDRSHGDIHPFGNPHFHLDPKKMVTVAKALATKLGELDPENSKFYFEQANLFAKKIQSKMISWQNRVNKSKVKQVLTYHKSFNYFLNRFEIIPKATIEPKPGIPPTIRHIISLIKITKEQNIKCILNESYFETTAGKRIEKESNALLQVVAVEAQTDYFDLIESLVTAVENCGKGKL